MTVLKGKSEDNNMMDPWLVHSSPDQAVQVQAPAEDTVLCSWARHLTFTVPLPTQECKWVPVNCWGNLHL